MRFDEVTALSLVAPFLEHGIVTLFFRRRILIFLLTDYLLITAAIILIFLLTDEIIALCIRLSERMMSIVGLNVNLDYLALSTFCEILFQDYCTGGRDYLY